jgi:hypothetical protein
MNVRTNAPSRDASEPTKKTVAAHLRKNQGSTVTQTKSMRQLKDSSNHIAPRVCMKGKSGESNCWCNFLQECAYFIAAIVSESKAMLLPFSY